MGLLTIFSSYVLAIHCPIWLAIGKASSSLRAWRCPVVIILDSHLNDYLPKSISIELNRERLIELRNTKSSKGICEEHFTPLQLDYKKQILNLSLVRYYLFMNYAQASFDMDCNQEMKKADQIRSSYTDAKNELNEFISQTKP